MRGRIHHLSPWLRRLLVLTGVALLATGVAWLVLHYGAATDGLPNPLEAWLMRAHGLASFAALFTLGALAASHVPHGWRLSSRRNFAHQRWTGLALCTLAALLALSAYLLYYFAPELVRPALGWTHSLAGIGMAVVVTRHARQHVG